MKRKWKLVLCLFLAALTLSACSSKPDPEDFPDITQAIGPTYTPAPAATDAPAADAADDSAAQGGESIFSANPFDVAGQEFSEQDVMDEEDYFDPEYDTLYASEPAGTVYPYAGSTPIPLDPIDMPTPTPRAPLNFTYVAYTASTVGVTFEAPVGWQVDESQPYMFILSDPQIRDKQQCIVTISAEPVSGNYDQDDLKTHVNQRLGTIGGAEFVEWKPSYTATRYMMGSEGVYANYTGVLSDGTEVGGRIHYVSIDSVLYGLEIIYPLGFKDDLLDVFGQIRSSMAMIR